MTLEQTVSAVRRLTKAEEETQKKKAELAEKRRLEDEECRRQEDKIIAQIEKDFWANTEKMNDTPDPVGKPCTGPGIPVAAPSLDELISDADLDRLLQYMEDGEGVTLEPRSAAFPNADQETVQKAQQLVEIMAKSLADDDRRRAEKQDDREQRVKEEQERLARGEECEMARLFKHKLLREAEAEVGLEAGLESQVSESEEEIPKATALGVEEPQSTANEEPQFTVKVEEAGGKATMVVVRVMLPLVSSASGIDAGVCDGKMLELEVEGLYSLRTELPLHINEDEMACRFDKKKKTLVIKLPVLT